MSEKRHVVRDGDGWAVKKPGADRVSSRHDERDEALERAGEIVANAGGGSVVVHGDDGKIERVSEVGRDGTEGSDSSSASSGARHDDGHSTPPRDEDGQFVAEGDGDGGDGHATPPRDEDGQFVAEDDGDGRDGHATPSRDEDGRFVAGSGGSDGEGTASPRDAREGSASNGGDDSRSLRDVAASVLEKGKSGEGVGALLPESVDRQAVVDKVGEGARGLASALGTAGKLGASAAIVVGTAAFRKGKQHLDNAKIERARRAEGEQGPMGMEGGRGTTASLGSAHRTDAGDRGASDREAGADSAEEALAGTADVRTDHATERHDSEGGSALADATTHAGERSRSSSSDSWASDPVTARTDSDRHAHEAAASAGKKATDELVATEVEDACGADVREERID